MDTSTKFAKYIWYIRLSIILYLTDRFFTLEIFQSGGRISETRRERLKSALYIRLKKIDPTPPPPPPQ